MEFSDTNTTRRARPFLSRRIQISGATHLPEHQAALGGTHDKHVADESEAADPLGEGHEGLLVPAQPRVDVDVGLLMLGGEDVGLADGKAVDRNRALLEGRLDRVGGAEGVAVDADVLGDGRVGGQRGPADG